jgi:hypothetical protein
MIDHGEIKYYGPVGVPVQLVKLLCHSAEAVGFLSSQNTPSSNALADRLWGHVVEAVKSFEPVPTQTTSQGSKKE